MRITYVSHALPPYEFAGTPIYTLNIAKAQAAAGHEVSVFARLEDLDLPAYRMHDESRDGLRIRFVNRPIDWSSLDRSYTDDRMKKIFGEFLDEMRPEVVHFQHILGMGVGCVAAVAERGIKSVMTLNDFWTMCPMGQRVCYTDFQICDPIDFGKCGPCVFGAGWQDPGADKPADPAHPAGIVDQFESFFRERISSTPGLFARRPRAMLWAAGQTLGSLSRRFRGSSRGNGGAPRSRNPFIVRFEEMKRTLGMIDLLVAPSSFLRDEFIKLFGVSPDRIVQSGYGMDLSYIERLPKAPSKRVRFGFMGSIIRPKGVHVLLDAFLRAVTGRVDLELHVFGSPNAWTKDYFEELKQKGAHCPFVTFHGPFDNKEISRVLQQFDVLVVPSIWFENAPLTLSEAAIAGTPVLVSDRGGMLEFVRSNGYGWTFKLGDANDLADKMLRLADDPTLVPTLGGNPPRIKGLDENARELFSIYEGLIDGTWRPPAPPEPARRASTASRSKAT